MKPRIVFLDEYTLSNADLDPIRMLGDYTGYENTFPAELAAHARGAEILITNKVVLDAEALGALPDLRLVCIAATGKNMVDCRAAGLRGIDVRNAAGYSTRSVAEATLGAAIALLRHTVYYDRYIHGSAYAAQPLPYHYARPTRQLGGSRWGIVGLGAIGHEVARMATALGCTVAYASTSGVKREEPYPVMALDELLGWADVLSIHAPLCPETRGLIGAAELRRMKPTALLLNMARGGIVDEAALVEALDAGTIAGAALDVFEHEPLRPDDALLRMADPDRLLLSPHNAWSADRSLDALVACIANNIRSYLAGK